MALNRDALEALSRRARLANLRDVLEERNLSELRSVLAKLMADLNIRNLQMLELEKKERELTAVLRSDSGMHIESMWRDDIYIKRHLRTTRECVRMEHKRQEQIFAAREDEKTLVRGRIADAMRRKSALKALVMNSAKLLRQMRAAVDESEVEDNMLFFMEEDLEHV
jgi:hypothetical protein